MSAVWFQNVPKSQRHLVDQALRQSKDEGYRRSSKQIFEMLRAEERARQFEVPDSATLGERSSAIAKATQRVIDLLASEAEQEHRKYGNAEEPFDRAAWEADLAQRATENPDGIVDQIESVAPGLTAAWQAANSSFTDRGRDLVAEIAPKMQDVLGRLPHTSGVREVADRALTRSVLAGDDTETAEQRLLRQLVEAGQSAALLDAANGDPKIEQRIFAAAAEGPTEPVADPHANLSDAQIEAMLEGRSGPAPSMTDRPLPDGVAVTPIYTNHDAKELKKFEAEVAAMENEAQSNSAKRDYSNLFRQ